MYPNAPGIPFLTDLGISGFEGPNWFWSLLVIYISIYIYSYTCDFPFPCNSDHDPGLKKLLCHLYPIIPSPWYSHFPAISRPGKPRTSSTSKSHANGSMLRSCPSRSSQSRSSQSRWQSLSGSVLRVRPLRRALSEVFRTVFSVVERCWKQNLIQEWQKITLIHSLGLLSVHDLVFFYGLEFDMWLSISGMACADTIDHSYPSASQ